MKELTDAILAAGRELGADHGWSFDGGASVPAADGEFVQVLTRHLLPLVSADEFRAARIAALRAELAALCA